MKVSELIPEVNTRYGAPMEKSNYYLILTDDPATIKRLAHEGAIESLNLVFDWIAWKFMYYATVSTQC